MVELSRFFVKSYDADYLDVYWEFRDARFRVGRYDIYVDRSVDGQAGPFREIAGPFKNTGYLRDPNVNRFHNFRQYWYQLRILDHEHEDKVTTIDAVTLLAEPDLIAIEAGRRVDLALQEFVGRLVVVFPSITSGFRCPVCFDGAEAVGQDGKTVRRSMGRSKIQNCPSCFDTTYVGGYATPIATWIQIDPFPGGITRSDTYERSPSETSARLGVYPLLKPRDVLVDPENIRWEVERVSGVSKNNAIVQQDVILHQIVRNDIRYTLPINIDLKSHFSPPREFTRPMTIGYQESQYDVGGTLDRIFKRPA